MTTNTKNAATIHPETKHIVQFTNVDQLSAEELDKVMGGVDMGILAIAGGGGGH